MASTSESAEVILEKIYGIQFPPSFYDFVEFHKANAEVINDADLEIYFMGPFDMLQDPSAAYSEPHPLWEARYYDDPPEFLTFARGGCDGLHWGLYVDDPARPPFHIADYYSRDAFDIGTAGTNMFEFFRLHLEEKHVQMEEYLEEDDGGEDDDQEVYEEQLEALARLRAVFPADQTGDRPEVGSEYVDKYDRAYYGGWSPRNTVARTRDEMGIVVPEDKYVALAGPDALCSGPDPNRRFWPHEVEAWQREAMDLLEGGHPGAALKLGKDLWVMREHHEVAYSLLDAAYAALDRPLLRVLLKDAIGYRAHCDAENEKREAAKRQAALDQGT
ncbi:hypothetical protein K4F52_006431 [Lecanicillium sp. MT-2017a]|nr:hypothetical protein K4F52_006431 [Lecanicillium sp. MT-2017a]